MSTGISTHPAGPAALKPARELAQRLWGCRLCKSVTFSVFVLILAIESVILVPSAYNHRKAALLLLERQATDVMYPVTLVEGSLLKPRELERSLARVLRENPILAASIRRGDGSVIAQAGVADLSDFVIDDLLQGRGDRLARSSRGGACYDFAWSANVAGERLIFVTRMDSSSINTDLLVYVIRIAGLVTLIVLVVTMGTMMVLYRSVLSPILRLRRSMLDASADPDHADSYRTGERPGGELADVFQAHDEMLMGVAESKRADRQRAEERARFLTRHDALTGLPNRQFFLEHLREALTATGRRVGCVYVMVLNLTGFSTVNDSLGQQAGDQVLMEVARRLNLHVGAGEFLSRLGGDEFGISIAGCIDLTWAAQHAEQLLRGVELLIRTAEGEVRLRARIGIACSSDHCSDAVTLLHDAELALSRIRGDVLARYQFFSPEMMRQAKRQREIEHELRQAPECGGLQLFYQPKVALATGAADEVFSSCEALIRWQHPALGRMMPGDFIPVAEACGLIAKVGEWVLREACTQIRRWQDAGLAAPRVAVNLSAHQFHDAELCATVQQALTAAGILPGLLELEITESAVMGDVDTAMTVLHSLHEIGVSVSLDDFGTGYSSLSYLRQFDLDALKIDKSFVDDIGSDPGAEAICEAIIRLGRSLGMKIIAEGVEHQTQLEFLRARQCDEAQGYLFARPMPADEFGKRLATARSQLC